jgi:hypothetical protein
MASGGMALGKGAPLTGTEGGAGGGRVGFWITLAKAWNWLNTGKLPLALGKAGSARDAGLAACGFSLCGLSLCGSALCAGAGDANIIPKANRRRIFMATSLAETPRRTLCCVRSAVRVPAW